MPKPLTVLLGLLLAAGAAGAAERFFIDEQERLVPKSVREGDAWSEADSGLPPWPRDEDLVEFRLDGDTPFRYFIDGRNLAVGSDNVVRYTLVAESHSGARNVSVEGIRCTPTGVYKVYAYGNQGAFTPHETDWQPVPPRAPGDYRSQLHGHFLCVPLKFEPRPRKDMLRALAGHIRPRENAGFMSD
jgi:hypothetical protein